MLEPTEEETKWFVRKLIKIRENINGYHESFDFELKDLEEWEDESETKLPQAETKDRVFWMLKEMKDNYIENNNNVLFAKNLNYHESREGIITIDGYTSKMLLKYKNWLSLSPEARLALNIIPMEKIPTIKFKTKGKDFELNINDGSFKFGKIKNSFGTTTKEFRLLKCLVESRNSVVSYGIICSCLGINDGRTKRGAITTILKRVKYKMGILPKGRTSNPDIFISNPNIGYEISEN